MTRALAVLAGALLLAGCPLPQAVPDYPPGNITPPRILVDDISGKEGAVTFVPAGCATTQPVNPLNVSVLDTNVQEPIEARWFVNYDARYQPNYQPWQTDTVAPDADPTKLTRALPPFVFQPYQFGPPPDAPPDSGGSLHRDAGVVRVVELVVSNGFDPAAETTSYPLLYRTPRVGFETQVYRWTFLSVPESLAVPCP